MSSCLPIDFRDNIAQIPANGKSPDEISPEFCASAANVPLRFVAALRCRALIDLPANERRQTAPPSQAYGLRGPRTTWKRVTDYTAKTSPSLARKGGRGRRICGDRQTKHNLALFHPSALGRGRRSRQPASPTKSWREKWLHFFRGCKVTDLAEGARGARSPSKKTVSISSCGCISAFSGVDYDRRAWRRRGGMGYDGRDGVFGVLFFTA